MTRALVIGLEKGESREIEKFFLSVGLACEQSANFDNAIERITVDPPSLIVTKKPERLEMLYALRDTLNVNAPTTPFLVRLPKENSTDALEAMRAGAFDCLVPPFNRFTVLAMAKRAAHRNGRTLFEQKVEPKPNRALPVALTLLLMIGGGVTSKNVFEGPPPDTISLGSVHLSGIQWEGRSLWVGDWFESTVTRYEAKKGFYKRSRDLFTGSIYHAQDTQPILLCNTPDALISVGSDLKMRIHQRTVGLPALQTVAAPGPNPTGLAWDGKNIWSSDGTTNMIYRHAADLQVLESVKCVMPQPMGLAFDRGSLWVLGGKPLRLARLQRIGNSSVWSGPFDAGKLLPEDVIPSGLAVGFGRLWVVSGGDPRLLSRSLAEIMAAPRGWKAAVKPMEKKHADRKT